MFQLDELQLNADNKPVYIINMHAYLQSKNVVISEQYTYFPSLSKVVHEYPFVYFSFSRDLR